MFRRLPLFVLLLVLSSAAWSQTNDAFTFRGDRLTSTFTQGQERTSLSGNAVVTTGDLTIHADSIELSGKGFRYVDCRGAVVVKDGKKNLELKAESMLYDRTLKTSRFQGLCELADPEHGVTVKAGLFDYDQNAESMVLQAGVRIFKGELICRSEYAVYRRAQDTLELTGLPVVTKKKDVYKAGSIRVNLKTEDVILDGGVTGTITPEKKKGPAGSLPAPGSGPTPAPGSGPGAPPPPAGPPVAPEVKP